MKKVFAFIDYPQEAGDITLSFYDIESGKLLKVYSFGDIYHQQDVKYNPDTKKFTLASDCDHSFYGGTYRKYLYVMFNGDMNAMIQYFAHKSGFIAVIPEILDCEKVTKLTVFVK